MPAYALTVAALAAVLAAPALACPGLQPTAKPDLGELNFSAHHGLTNLAMSGRAGGSFNLRDCGLEGEGLAGYRGDGLVKVRPDLLVHWDGDATALDHRRRVRRADPSPHPRPRGTLALRRRPRPRSRGHHHRTAGRGLRRLHGQPRHGRLHQAGHADHQRDASVTDKGARPPGPPRPAAACSVRPRDDAGAGRAGRGCGLPPRPRAGARRLLLGRRARVQPPARRAGAGASWTRRWPGCSSRTSR